MSSGLEATGLSLQGLSPNATQPFGHSHKTQEEVYLVLSGSGRVKLDDEIVELRQWDAIRIPPEVMRAVSAGPDGMECPRLRRNRGHAPRARTRRQSRAGGTARAPASEQLALVPGPVPHGESARGALRRLPA